MAINGPLPEPNRNAETPGDSRVLIEYMLNERRSGPAMNPRRLIGYISRMDPLIESMEPERRQATEELLESHIGRDRKVVSEIIDMLEESEKSGNTTIIAQNLLVARRLGLHKTLPSFSGTYIAIKQRWGLTGLPDLTESSIPGEQSGSKDQPVEKQIRIFVQETGITPEERISRQKIVDALNKLMTEGKTLNEAMALLSGKSRISKKGAQRRSLLRGGVATALGLMAFAGKDQVVKFGAGLMPPSTLAASSPTASETSPNTVGEAGEGGIIQDIIAPQMMKYAQDKRAKESQEAWYSGVDRELNRDRLNLVFLGLGVEDEEFTDSVMVLSYCPTDNSLQIFNIPRDTHAPEIDRFRAKSDVDNPDWNAINMAYIEGKYPLVREVIADATGLSPDFIIKSKIEGFVYFIAEALGKVRIEVPETIDTTRVGFDYKWEKGVQEMTAKELSDYSRSRVTTSEPARNQRQQEVVQALIENLTERWNNGNILEKVQLLNSLKKSLKKQQDLGNIEADFDLDLLIMSKLVQVGTKLAATKLSHTNLVFDKPQIRNTVLDARYGLVPEHRADEARLHLLTIEGGDYTAPDLQEGYWKRFRQGVHKILKGGF